MNQINASNLRNRASKGWLEKLTEPVMLVSGRGQNQEPVAVLVPYALFMLWQTIMEQHGVDLAKVK